MKKNILWLVLMVMGTMLHVYAGENNPVKHGNTIRGHVIEKYSEEHLPYAAILIVETGAGAVSDESGHFRFKNIPAGTYTLRVQLLGYAMQEKLLDEGLYPYTKRYLGTFANHFSESSKLYAGSS